MINSTIDVHTIACLSDNYAFVIHNRTTGTAAVVDIPEAGPIVAKIAELSVPVTEIFLTHHHWDHIDGLDDLQKALTNQLGQKPSRVIGAQVDAHRLPPMDQAVIPGQTIQLCGIDGQIFDVSGHTLGHLALHIPAIKAVFTADSLMAMGCGRLFEGTPAQMWDWLQKLKALPDATRVFCAHEYTQSNGRFALSVEPQNAKLVARMKDVEAKRQRGEPTVPSTLAEEKATNPFLRPDSADLQATVGLPGGGLVDVFAETRARKDNF